MFLAAAPIAAVAAAAAAASNPGLNVAALLASGTQVTPQIAMAAQMAALQAKTLAETGIAVPSYYNPSSVNPVKFAEQEKKRKMLWQGKKDGVGLDFAVLLMGVFTILHYDLWLCTKHRYTRWCCILLLFVRFQHLDFRDLLIETCFLGTVMEKNIQITKAWTCFTLKQNGLHIYSSSFCTSISTEEYQQHQPRNIPEFG